jgi:hypothetical protein
VLLVLPNVREKGQQVLALAGLLTLGICLLSLLIALSQGQREGSQLSKLARPEVFPPRHPSGASLTHPALHV